MHPVRDPNRSIVTRERIVEVVGQFHALVCELERAGTPSNPLVHLASDLRAHCPLNDHPARMGNRDSKQFCYPQSYPYGPWAALKQGGQLGQKNSQSPQRVRKLVLCAP